MTKCITVIDYGMGNLTSIQRALESFDLNVKVTSRPEELINSDKVIIPGVGAFGDSMRELKERNLDEALKLFVKKGNPLLGICLGMQILFDESEELGINTGLGFMQGRVELIKNYLGDDINNIVRRIPHIGWSPIYNNKSDWDSKIFKNIDKNDFFYFVHSFICKTVSDDIIIACTNYNHLEIVAAVESENIIGLQFHPEKSSLIGLKVIENFINLY